MIHYVDKRVRPAFNYYGGKSRLSRRILQMSPPHTTYVECFAGGLNVLLQKYRSRLEVACDVSPELINFYHVLVNRCDELGERVRQTWFEKSMFVAATKAGATGDELTRAINFLCRQKMGFSGTGRWAKPVHKVHGWETLPDDLPIAARRLKGVKILLRSAFDVIPEYDSPETFFYCDPPYYGATRVSTGDYIHELSEWDHLRLLRLLKTVQGNVLLSGYDHPTYNKELADWSRKEFEVRLNCAGRTKPMRTEVVWVKPQSLLY